MYKKWRSWSGPSLGECPSKHLVTEQPAHTNSTAVKKFLLTIKTLGYEEFSMGITHPFRIHGSCRNGPTIQPNTVHSNQATRWGHSDRYSPLRSLKIGTGVRSGVFGRNVDKFTGVNPQGVIGTIIPEMNTVRRFPFRGLSGFTNWNALRHDPGQSEDHVCNNIKYIYMREKSFEFENFYQKNSNSIHIDLTYSNLNQYVSNKVDSNNVNPN